MATQLRPVLAALTMVAVVAPVAAFAQTDSRPLLMLARSSSTVARAYDPTVASPPLAELPFNLVVTPVFKTLIGQLLRDSPTFRRQCGRIAAAPQLFVTIQVEPPRPGQPAAATRVSRYESGRIRAEVRVPPTSRAPELIAHELEHVLEQLDGINLRAKSRLKSTGVRICECTDDTSFETERAVSTGRRVARELESGSRR